MGSHFEGKDVFEHLKEARLKGKIASSEVHGVETPGWVSASLDAVNDTTIALLILWGTFSFLPQSIQLPLLLVFGLSFCVWKTGRSALLGWRRMHRLHKLIEEERWEIEHHRAQEKEELKELYAAKGFQGKLLNDVVDVLMADEDRLLKVMLEEELGLTLEAYEHPLKQSSGAAMGSLLASFLLVISFVLFPFYGMPCMGALLLTLATVFLARKEIGQVLSTLVWTLSTALLCTLGSYLLSTWVKTL